MNQIDVSVFSSNNLTNIWAGVGAGLWAVAKRQKRKVRGATTKAMALQIGSLGVLYCSKNKSFTTPFVVFSHPDLQGVVRNVWSEEWVLPFSIHPLGTPRRLLHKDKLRDILPSLSDGTLRWNKLLLVAPTTIFSASKLQPSDWDAMLGELSE